MDLPYDPAIPLLGIYPKKCDSGYYRGTCTPMFIAVLFTIAKLWKQPRCPTTDKWMELQNIILSEVSQAQKTKNHMFSLICGL
jgi:hypothetical protein